MEDSVTMEETSDDEDSSRLSFSSMGFANLPERQDIIVEKTEKNTHKEKALRTLRTDKRAIESGPGGHFLADNGEPMAYCRCRSSDCSQVIVACDHCEEKCVGVGEPAVKFIIKSACVPSEEKTPTLSVINKERKKKKEKSKLDKPSEKKITKKKKQFLKEKKMKMKDRLKMKRSKKLKMMQTKEKRGIGSGEKTGVSEAEPSGDYSPATNAQNVTKAAQDDEDSSRLSFSSMGFANLPERQDIIVEKTEKNTHKEKALRTLRTDKRAIESGPGGHFLADNGEPMAYCRCRSSDCSQVIVACDHCEEKCVGVGEPAVKFIIKSACVPSEEKTPTLSVINKERKKKKEKSKLDKPSEKKITKKKKQFLKEKKMKMKDRLKMKRSKKLKMMQTKEKRGIGSGEKTGVSEAEPSGDYSPATNAQNVTKAAQQANRRCGECEACKRKDDCGQCVFCKDMKKVGGPIKIRQKCRFKQCLKRASPNIFQLGSMFFTFPDQTPRRDATIAWCREHGLLSTEMTCPSCDDRCKEVRRERCKDKVAWRCRNTKCRKIINLRKGSFFESSHLELWQIIGLSHIWASSGRRTQGPTQLSIMRDICVSSSVVADWKQFLKDVCVQYFADQHEQIGGPGKVVEVYESFFTHRKNSVGRQRQQRWVLCGFEQARKIGFMVEVPSRDAATLLTIIEHWVAPGSVIWTDLRGAYAHLGNQPGLGDIHETVNHKVHFMDPAKGVTTMWARAKAKYKASHRSTKPNSIGDYLKEFMWFQRFGDSAFYQLWLQIADLYPV